MPNREHLQLRRIGRVLRLLREQIDNALIQADFPLARRDANRHGRERFAQGIDSAQLLLRVGRPIRFVQHLIMAQQHHADNADVLFFQPLQQLQDVPAVQPHFFRGCPHQLIHGFRLLQIAKKPKIEGERHVFLHDFRHAQHPEPPHQRVHIAHAADIPQRLRAVGVPNLTRAPERQTDAAPRERLALLAPVDEQFSVRLPVLPDFQAVGERQPRRGAKRHPLTRHHRAPECLFRVLRRPLQRLNRCFGFVRHAHFPFASFSHHSTFSRSAQVSSTICRKSMGRIAKKQYKNSKKGLTSAQIACMIVA